ncbi:MULTISPECIES: hypothetical protein [Nocardiopsis]|uniref:DUF5129 domain-containing protein n=1 Tax=Nocardiopsis sinuspersici TaxID=501010 RepID=A0A1V3C0P8_9ACTN|nr:MULTISPECIES: hypothetical protein [Nocardiopsis]OOC54374.1 hypothetical protein NOSIN_11615 [Nocardiopsis sinuspersici]
MRALVLSFVSVLTVLFALSPLSSAHADTTWSYDEVATVRGPAALKDPLYVGLMHQPALGMAAEEALQERLEESEVPVYVVLLSQRTRLKNYPERLAHSAGSRGYFFAVGRDGVTIHGAQSDMDGTVVDGMDTAQLAAAAVNGDPELAEASLAERLNRVVDLVEDGKAVDAYRDMRDGPAPPWEWLALGVGAAAAALWFGVRWWSRRPIRVVPLSEEVSATVSQAQRDGYRTRLEERLTGCGQRVSARQDSSDKVRQALEAYTAAAKVLDSAADKSDLVGVHVLLDMCEAALDGEISPVHCFFDPRHDGGKAPVRWRSPASFDSVRVMACRECRKAVRQHRTPPAVPDSTGGRPLPYYAVSPEHSVWAATGYGTLTPDLPARVVRGDHRR